MRGGTTEDEKEEKARNASLKNTHSDETETPHSDELRDDVRKKH